MPLVPTSNGDESIVAVVPREKFRMLDNWGDLIGLKGSGSHSVVIEDATIPEHHTIPVDEWLGDRRRLRRPATVCTATRCTAGRSWRSRSGELNSVQVGNAQGAVDEYERLLSRPTRQATAARGGAVRRPELPALLGLALAYTDAAYSILDALR